MVLLQEYFQSVFDFSRHFLARSIHLDGKGCIHHRVVNLLHFSRIANWILLPVLDLILYQLLNLVLIVEVVHLFDDRAPEWLLNLSLLDLHANVRDL